VGKAVIVSWVTVDEPGSSNVIYWSENSKEKKQAKGKVVTYKFYFWFHSSHNYQKVEGEFHSSHNYTSVFIQLFH